MAGGTRLLATVCRMGTPPRTRPLIEVGAVRGVLRLPVRIEARGLDVRHVSVPPGEARGVYKIMQFHKSKTTNSVFSDVLFL